MYHKQKPLPVGTTFATDSMSSGSRLSHQIQEDLIALLDERDVDSETVTSVCQIVVNHFKEQLPRPRTHLGKSRQRQDQMEREILSLYEGESYGS